MSDGNWTKHFCNPIGLKKGGNCTLGNHNFLIYPPPEFQDECDVVLMSSLDESTNHLVLNSLENDLSLAVKISPRLNIELMCYDTTKFIYSSVSGHLVSFKYKSGFVEMSSILGYLADYKVKRPKRDTDLSNRTVYTKITILDEPPKLNSLNRRSRFKRSSVSNYPEYQRINYLEEKMNSGFSRITSAVNTNIGENQFLML